MEEKSNKEVNGLICSSLKCFRHDLSRKIENNEKTLNHYIKTGKEIERQYLRRQTEIEECENVLKNQKHQFNLLNDEIKLRESEEY